MAKKKKLKHWRHTCYNCKKKKWCTWSENPYIADVENRIDKHFFCDDCLDNLARDI